MRGRVEAVLKAPPASLPTVKVATVYKNDAYGTGLYQSSVQRARFGRTSAVLS
jgi:hypothetical protein